MAAKEEELDEEQLLAREEAMKAEEALMADLRRKAAEMDATRMREQQLSKVSRRRVQHHWLKIMRQVKAEELLRDVEVLSQAHDHLCDRRMRRSSGWRARSTSPRSSTAPPSARTPRSWTPSPTSSTAWSATWTTSSAATSDR